MCFNVEVWPHGPGSPTPVCLGAGSRESSVKIGSNLANLNRDQAVAFYQAFFKIKELVALAIFQLESSDSEDRDSALQNLELAATLAADSSREMRELISPDKNE